MIPKMRLSSGSVGLPLARVPGWTGGSGAVCWQKAMNPQKQLAPRRAATRITSWMLACHRELQGIAMNGTLGAPSRHSRNELLVRAICVGEHGLSAQGRRQTALVLIVIVKVTRTAVR